MEKTDKNIKTATLKLIEGWEGLSGSTLSPAGWKGLAKSLLELANTWGEAEYLIDKIRTGFERRPAPIEMRRVFCQKFKPADGIEDTDADMTRFAGGGFSRKSDAGGGAS